MAGTLANARIWSGADVYVGDLDASAPTDTTSELGADWELLGLLDDDAGIGRSFTSERTDHWAYGSVLVRTTNVKQKRSMTVTALEDTDLVFHLANPGSESEEAGGVTTRTIRQVNEGLALRSVVLELTDGDVTKRIYIPRAQFSEGDSESITDNAIDGTALVLDILSANDGEGGVYSALELTDDSGAAPSGS